jgi:hypothetical protein
MPYQQLPRKTWSRTAWVQIRTFTKKKIIGLLNKDDRWELVKSTRGPLTYYNSRLPKPHDQLRIHDHPGARFNDEGLLKDLLDQICWDEAWLIEHKAIKKR